MSRYIEADNLIKKMQERYNDLLREGGYYDNFTQGYEDALSAVENEPTADVQKVRRGVWLPILESEITGWNPEFAGRDPVGGYICSICKNEAIYSCNDEWVLSDFCPYCGAKMDGGKSDE